MKKLIFCKFNMDTACAELKFIKVEPYRICTLSMRVFSSILINLVW